VRRGHVCRWLEHGVPKRRGALPTNGRGVVSLTGREKYLLFRFPSRLQSEKSHGEGVTQEERARNGRTQTP
jgi:hypothetical protein